MRINQPELEPRPNDVTHGVSYQEDGVYNEIENTYLEAIDDATLKAKTVIITKWWIDILVVYTCSIDLFPCI
jgi:hypothetical protein